MLFSMERIVIALSLLLSVNRIRCHSITAESGTNEFEYADYYEDAADLEDYLYYEDLDGTSCPRSCSCFVNTVDCSRSGFLNISSTEVNDAKTFSGLLPEDTTTLHLGFNNLTALPSLLFWREGFNNKLQNLYLQGNEIRYVHPDAFAALPNLTDLDLSSNSILKFTQRCDTMQDDTLAISTPPTSSLSCATSQEDALFLRSASSNLLSLNLNSNKLNGIPSFTFSSFPALEVLKLSWNKIAWISPRAFGGLTALKVLHLRSNHLNAVTLSRLGVTLGFMEIPMPLSGDDDNQPLISMQRFRGTRYGNAVQFRGLTELDLGDTGLTSIPNIQGSSMKRLYLDSNHITTIRREDFQSLQRLEVLHLGENNIRHIEGATFAPLRWLKVLDLSRNDLHVISQYTFEGLQNLHSLRLYENQYLSEIHRDVFVYLWSLRLLYLQNCNLTTLHTDCWIHTTKCLWLYGNPIDCNCEVSYNLMTFFQRRRANSKPLLDPFRSLSCGDDMDTWPSQSQQRSVCAKPEAAEGMEIHSITHENLSCRSEGMVYSYVSAWTSGSESNPFWARVFCEKRARRQRRFQRFSQADPSTSHGTQSTPSDASRNDFESIFGDFSNSIEVDDFQFIGEDPAVVDDGTVIISSADEIEDSMNPQSQDGEDGDEMLSMLYNALVYDGEWNITQTVSPTNPADN